MSLYEGISILQFMKRPFRVFSNAYNSFASGEKTGMPFKVKFESSTLCNLKCVMCPLTKGLTRKRGILKFDNFKKVYDEVKFPYVNLTGLGEPLMNPEIFRIISYARKKGSLVKLDTNGTLLSKENIMRLIQSDPTFISVSIDGVDKNSYEKIRKGGNFEEVVKNLNNLIEYRNKSGSKSQIHLFFVLQKSNIDNLIDFIKFGDMLGVDAVNANIAISFGKADNQKNIKISRKKLDEVRRKLETVKKQVKVKLNIENVEDFLKSPEKMGKVMAEKPCFYPWYSPCITWDGYVVPCDIHCDNEVVFGNAFEEPFIKVWNNKKAREFRKQLVKKRDGICARCCVDETFIAEKFKIFYKLPVLNKITKKRWI